MKTFVINLKDASERKRYMESVLHPYAHFLDIEFIEAVDGRKFTDEDINKLWDEKATYKTYGRTMGGGEIGCALSHRKCYEALLKTEEEMALIVEDDLMWRTTDIEEVIRKATPFLQTEQATIVLLSGDYWFTSKQKIKGSPWELARIREAVCTQAYIVNRHAAQRMLAMRHQFLADDWFHIKKQGIKLLGIYPHIADQNRKDFQGGVTATYAGTIRKNLSFVKRLHSYYRAIVKRMLVYTGHFEYHDFGI